LKTQDYIQENEIRKGILFCEYDPLSGIGSPIPRFEFKLSKTKIIYLPESAREYLLPELIENPEKFTKLAGGTLENLEEFVHRWRRKFDFEYWCASDVKITDKEGAFLIPFRLRPAQRKLFSVLHKMFSEGKPILAILGKARQWGGSTLVQIFMIWLQKYHYTNWNSVIVGDNENQARNVRGMYTRLLSNLPEDDVVNKLSPFENSNKNRVLVGRDCVVSIGSMQQPESLRTMDLKMAHLTEVASWKKTLSKTPEDLTQNIRATIPMIAGAMEVLESTAKGVGNFFHQEYLAAKTGQSGYVAVFVSWFEIEMYVKPFESEADKANFIENLDEYGLYLWTIGATLEGIHWYQHFKKTKHYSDWRMKSEFPSTDTEMFQSSATRAFDPTYVEKARVNNCPPIFIGDIIADAQKGKKAFENIRFVENPQGALKIWAFPDKEQVCTHRYVVPMDIGGRAAKSDNSVIRVIDRLPLTYGGVPEAILTYTGHIDHDLLAFKGAQIAHSYWKGLYIPESNSIDKDGETEGDHLVTVLDEVLPHYGNIFCRTDPERIKQGFPARYGFHTNKKTKPDLVSNINAAFRDEGYIEMDSEVCDEADQYETKDNGSYGAVSGSRDDRLVATAIGLKGSDLMPMPVLITTKIKRTITRSGSMAEL